jgi:hypothetical protein
MKLSQNLSSSTLFHFTNEFKYLTSIIKDGFQARYGAEKLPKMKLAYLSPMICFCDIPLGSVKYHLSRYGGYGIGIRKQILKEKGVTPLLYIHSKSPQITITGSPKNLNDLKESELTPYLKQYLGYDPVLDPNTRKVLKLRKINYMNEKEWRFVPKPTEVEIRKYRTNQELIKWKDDKNKLGKISFLKISNLEEIEYIILAKTTDVKLFIGFLETLRKTITFNKDIILPKILTQGQILRDF